MAEAIAISWGRRPRRPPSPAEIIRAARDGGKGTLLAEPSRTAGLRLNRDDGRRYPPDRLAEMPDNAAKLAALKEEIARDVEMFARNQHRFLDLYFAFIDGRVAEQREALDERLAWSGGIFTAADFAFSAWRPLPNATVVADDQATQEILACDFAFWTGTHLIALTVKALARLGEKAAQPTGSALLLVDLPATELGKERGVFTQARFPREFLCFWEGDPIPSSPFRPEGLQDGIQARQD